MNPVSAPLGLIWRHRRIIWAVVSNELKARYAGSVLGVLWLALYPMLFLATYAVVYLFVFKIRPVNIGLNPIEYVAMMFCGLVPFISFAECLSTGTPSVSSSPQLMKNTLFPIALLPVKVVLCAQVVQLVGLVMITIAMIVLARIGIISKTIGIHYPWVLAIWFLQVVFCTGMVWILSAANVFVRDLGQITGLLNLLLMMVSPIAWTERMIQELVPQLSALLKLNPLYYIIISYQRAIMLGEPPSWPLLGTLAAAAAVLFFGGYKVFSALQQVFIENV